MDLVVDPSMSNFLLNLQHIDQEEQKVSWCVWTFAWV
jgi:hypothetical protein